MAPTPYYYLINHGPPTRLRALMNGVPFYRCEPESEAEGATHTAAANGLLVPGENVLSLDVLEADTFYSIIVEMTIAFDHKSPVFRVDWPKLWKAYADEEKVIPFTHQVRFEATGVRFTPAYLRAPRAEFDHRGTPALREAVARYHDTIARNDVDAFMHENAFKIAEADRAFEGHPAFAPGPLREAMRERFQAGVTARPLDLDALQFESYAEGRVAYVVRADGGPALEAECTNDDAMRTDLWLTQIDGQWRVFR